MCLAQYRHLLLPRCFAFLRFADKDLAKARMLGRLALNFLAIFASGM